LIAYTVHNEIFDLAPINGVVANTKSRRNILLATQIAPMALSFTLAVLTLTGRVQVWHVFAIAALLGVVNAFDFPVRQAFVAELVTKEDLMSAVTLNSSMINSARTIGPGIGGLLVASVGEGWAFLFNALSFGAVIIGLLFIKSNPSPKKAAPHFRAGIAEAFHFVRHTGPVGGLMILLGLISFMGLRYEILMPVYTTEMLHGGPTEFGLLMGASGIGAILGSLILAMFGNVRTLGDWAALAAAGGMACIMGAMGFGFSLPILQREAKKLILKREQADQRVTLGNN